MDLLERRITGDWIEVREKLNTPNRLKVYLKLEDTRISTLTADLRGSTMAGIVEFKKKEAGGFFHFLNRLAYTTPTQTEILSAEADFRALTYVLGWETQFATGQIKPPKEAEGPLAGNSSRNRAPLDDVLNEVKGRVAANPELAKNVHVKNIFMEMQVYQKEFAQFSALSPQIPDDRAATFFLNYKKRLDGILDNIHSHLRDVRMAEDESLRKEFLRQEEDQFVVPELTRIVQAQAQEITVLRSSINHALQEGYQIRALLLKLADRRQDFFDLLDQELKILDQRQEPDAKGHPAAVKLARAIAAILETGKK